MKTPLKGLAIGVAILAVTVSAAPRALAAGAELNKVKAGYMTCHVASGFGVIFGSSRELNCTYTAAGGETEYYKGKIGKFGADIGYLQSGVILWTVLAPSSNTGPGALAGHYAGAPAGATVGVGAGVGVMTGGLHNSIALQPVSVEGNTGLNVAAGVATMDLDWVQKSSMRPIGIFTLGLLFGLREQGR